MTDASEIQILITPPGGSPFDLTNFATIAGATFASNANATPGAAQIVLRDMDRELSLVTGSRLKLKVDDQPMWSGFGLRIGRSHFFPAGDGKEDTPSRQFILYGVDNNILLDKRYMRDTGDYLSQLPLITSSTFDGEILRMMLASYADMPDWLDISTFIDDVYQHPDSTDTATNKGWAWIEQGTKIRAQFEDLSRSSGAVFYIGPDDAVHHHALQDIESPWGFSDRPNKAPLIADSGFEGSYAGFRELSGDEDGGDFATDAFIWGGSPIAGTGTTVFARATDAVLEAIHGKWQLAETHFNETNFKTQQTVTQRANVVVFGNPAGTSDLGGSGGPGSVAGEGPRGLRYPQYSYGLTWHTRDVPTLSGAPRHLRPGDLTSIQLWTFSQDDGVTPFTKLLPMRALGISFPSGAKDGKAYVEFRGAFDLRNEDPFTLWKYLRSREPKIITQTIATANDDSTTFVYGGLGKFTATPDPDGSTTVFTIPVGYIAGTTVLYLDTTGDGGSAVDFTDYTESDPEAGELTFTSPPATGVLLVTCRTLDG